MALHPMAPGGRWMRPPHDAPPVYIPAKQTEAHVKRLAADGWVSIDDPRAEEMQQAHAHVQAEVASVSAEIAAQSRIDRLEALVTQQTALIQQLLAQKEQPDDSTRNAGSTDSESSNTHQRPVVRKSAV